MDLNSIHATVFSTFLTKFKEGEHPVGPFHMHFLESAMNALLLWNDHTIIYSFRNNNDWGELLLTNGNNVNVASGGEKIHQVILGMSPPTCQLLTVYFACGCTTSGLCVCV